MPFDPTPYMPYIAIVGTIYAIISNRKKLTDDHDKRVSKEAVNEERAAKLKESVDAAHIKIRALETERHETALQFVEIKAQMKSMTEIMTRIERALDSHVNKEAV